MKKLASIILMSAVLLTGCSSKPATPTPTPTPTPAPSASEDSSGNVAISGSTSTEKIIKALADEYMALNPDVKITYEGIGSSAGIKNAIDGVSQIGTASREVKEEEKAQGIEIDTFAHDGIAVIFHPDNGVTNLTLDQLKAIYAGEITNWKEVGGADQKIVVVSREEGSGTRSAFEEILKLEGILKDATIAEGNGNVQTTVAGNPQAIGYVSFSSLNETVKASEIEGSAPTVEGVLAGEYQLARPFVMVYRADKIDQATQGFIDFTDSAEGKAIVEENGGIVE